MLVAITLFAIVAKRVAIPYPVVFVLGGAALALVPNLPEIALPPELVFLIFLPPLLTSAAWGTDFRAFVRERRAIGLLSVGLVIATTLAVGWVAHVYVDLPWAPAFALGAIVAPTDTIAMEAIAERISVNRRVLTILSGESLVNDATSLVIYRFAIAAGAAGAFSLSGAVVSFFVVALGGVAVGLGVALAVELLQRFLNKTGLADALIDNVVLLLLPFAAYLPAENLHVSGVLATVTAGMYLSRRWSSLYSAETRLVGESIWNVLTFLMNGAVFILLGLQLRSIVHDLMSKFSEPAGRLIWEATEIALVVIAVRFLWVFPATYLPRFIPAIRRIDPPPPWRFPFVISWAGMRGIVSLAAALAVPITDAGGRPFPGRAEIIFTTFVVIFATLVLQGITLPLVIRVLKVDDDDQLERREIEIRIKALKAGMLRLRELEPEFDSTTEWEVEGRILAEYEHRITHLRGHADGTAEDTPETLADHRLQEEALAAERREIASLRSLGEIPGEIYRNIERDLDLAEQRLR
jgi:CPA1 family monovalent cation:H+ antiporter